MAPDTTTDHLGSMCHSAVMTVPLLLLGLPAVASAKPPERAPAPDLALVQKAQFEIRDLFKSEYARRASADQRALAEKLLQLALETKSDPVSRFVLLMESRDLAAQAGEPAIALRAASHAAHEYAIDGLGFRAEAVERAEKSATSPAIYRAVAEATLGLVDEAVQQGRYTVAVRLIALAVRTSSKSKIPVLTQRATQRSGEVQEVAAAYAACWELDARLRDDPKDKEAGRAIGRFRCLYQGDWSNGVPLLSEFADGKLQEIARKEKAGPATADGQLVIADGWWDLATGEKGLAAAQLRRRAAHWYRRALPELAGLARTRVEKRISMVEPPGPWDHLDLANGELIEDFVRITLESQITTREEYTGPIDVTVVARTQGNNIRLFGPNESVLIFNWERNQRELRVHLPDGENGRPNSGSIVGRAVRPLAANTWYTLRWRLTARQVDVWVDGRTVFSEKGKFDLTAKSPVRVGAREHSVDVRSIAVLPVK